MLNRFQGESGLKVEPVNIQGRININSLSFAYPDSGALILQNMSLTFLARHFYGIIGASGSGKSTLLKLLMGQEHAEIGQVVFDGQDIKKPKTRCSTGKFWRHWPRIEPLCGQHHGQYSLRPSVAKKRLEQIYSTATPSSISCSIYRWAYRPTFFLEPKTCLASRWFSYCSRGP